MDGKMDERTDGQSNRKYPHSTGLRPLSGPPPKKVNANKRGALNRVVFGQCFRNSILRAPGAVIRENTVSLFCCDGCANSEDSTDETTCNADIFLFLNMNPSLHIFYLFH